MRRRRSWPVLSLLTFVLVVGAGALAPVAGALSFGAATTLVVLRAVDRARNFQRGVTRVRLTVR
jgi:hypothetical protein